MTGPLILNERRRKVGDAEVGRLLPFPQKKMIGPFIFIDHMGPELIGPGKYIEVGQHPHIGLSTLTWLLEGELLHKDSLGSHQPISPGDVNWMTAGSGIVHVEHTAEKLKDGASHPVHGYQIWVALPREFEDTEPAFHHSPASLLPSWSKGELHFTLVAGKGFGRQSPVPVYSDLFMLQIQTDPGGTLNTEANLSGELGLVVISGSVEYRAQTINENQILIVSDSGSFSCRLDSGTKIFLLGGEALPEDRHMYWNFVHTSKEKIDEARERWVKKEFLMVENETSYMPAP